jgi:hypothetical protein
MLAFVFVHTGTGEAAHVRVGGQPFGEGTRSASVKTPDEGDPLT